MLSSVAILSNRQTLKNSSISEKFSLEDFDTVHPPEGDKNEGVGGGLGVGRWGWVAWPALQPSQAKGGSAACEPPGTDRHQAEKSRTRQTPNREISLL